MEKNLKYLNRIINVNIILQTIIVFSNESNLLLWIIPNLIINIYFTTRFTTLFEKNKFILLTFVITSIPVINLVYCSILKYIYFKKNNNTYDSVVLNHLYLVKICVDLFKLLIIITLCVVCKYGFNLQLFFVIPVFIIIVSFCFNNIRKYSDHVGENKTGNIDEFYKMTNLIYSLFSNNYYYNFKKIVDLLCKGIKIDKINKLYLLLNKKLYICYILIANDKDFVNKTSDFMLKRFKNNNKLYRDLVNHYYNKHDDNILELLDNFLIENSKGNLVKITVNYLKEKECCYADNKETNVRTDNDIYQIKIFDYNSKKAKKLTRNDKILMITFVVLVTFVIPNILKNDNLDKINEYYEKYGVLEDGSNILLNIDPNEKENFIVYHSLIDNEESINVIYVNKGIFKSKSFYTLTNDFVKLHFHKEIDNYDYLVFDSEIIELSDLDFIKINENNSIYKNQDESLIVYRIDYKDNIIYCVQTSQDDIIDDLMKAIKESKVNMLEKINNKYK